MIKNAIVVLQADCILRICTGSTLRLVIGSTLSLRHVLGTAVGVRYVQPVSLTRAIDLETRDFNDDVIITVTISDEF